MAQTVLITGSSSGIGRITAQYFQWKGWNVLATMRHPENENELNLLENVICLRLDVENVESIRAAMAEGIRLFGRIDVVVNNAGYGTIGPFEGATSEQVNRQFNVNVFGVMNVTREILPHFRANRAGTVVNVASAGGRITWPLYSLYHASKWALEGFSESLHFELRPFGIRVKIIEPGAIQTDFYGRSQEVAESRSIREYDAYVNLCVPNLQEAGVKAPGPEEVAARIYRAATDGSWTLRYSAGRGAGWVLWARRLFPERLFLWMVRKVVEKRQDRLKKYKQEE